MRIVASWAAAWNCQKWRFPCYAAAAAAADCYCCESCWQFAAAVAAAVTGTENAAYWTRNCSWTDHVVVVVVAAVADATVVVAYHSHYYPAVADAKRDWVPLYQYFVQN